MCSCLLSPQCPHFQFYLVDFFLHGLDKTQILGRGDAREGIHGGQIVLGQLRQRHRLQVHRVGGLGRRAHRVRNVAEVLVGERRRTVVRLDDLERVPQGGAYLLMAADLKSGSNNRSRVVHCC
jgi:hypothetical protein